MIFCTTIRGEQKKINNKSQNAH